MTNILIEAKREMERLRGELSRNPVFQRLQAIQRLIEIYESAPEKEAITSKREQVTVATRPVATSKTAIIEEAAVAFLKGLNRRATSGEILAHMQSVGIEIGGKKPLSTMASYLSNSKKLNNVPKRGYGLEEWPVEHKSEDESKQSSLLPTLQH